jgi:peptidoglycan/LPS O-acetylase OafA/YrhL
VLLFHARILGFGNGDIGVDIFFVLSGFLITSILLSRNKPGARLNFGDFYRRRALRLLPAYFAVLIFSVVLGFTGSYGGTFKGAAISLVYMANWAVGLTGAGLGMLGHTWSLSIEEQFYLVWPALLYFLLRRLGWNGRSLLAAVAGLVLMSWLLVDALAVIGAPARIASNATPTRAVELLIGALLAIFVATPSMSGTLPKVRARSWVSVAGVAAGLGLLALLPVTGTSENINFIVGWPLISVLTCTVIYACLRAAAPVTVPLGTRFMTGVGKRAYGLYLWHFPIFVAIDTRWGLGNWTAKLAAIAITAGVVMLSYRCIERPFLERKDRRRPEASPAPASSGEPAPRIAASETPALVGAES